MALTIFRYPGGKSRRIFQDAIRATIPQDVEEYREPFIGGGSVFLGLPREFRTRVQSWINDRHSGLVEVYRALRDRPQEFIRQCRKIAPPLNEESVPPPTYNRRMFKLFHKFKGDTGMDQALRYYYLNRTSWIGRVIYCQERRHRMYFSNPTGWNIVKTESLSQAAQALKNVRITCGDFEPLFMENPLRKVWIYADPPYYRNLNLVPGDRQYDCLFSIGDFKRFRECCEKTPHLVCLSWDDLPAVRNWANRCGFRIQTVVATYCSTSLAKKPKVPELLITNYDPKT